MSEDEGPPAPGPTPGVLLQVWHEGDRSWPVLSWTAPAGWVAIASSVVGGGIGELHWWVNSTVSRQYHREDPDLHVAQIAAGLGLPADRRGVGMLTAADVSAATHGQDGGVQVCATVGLGLPVWAAAPAEVAAREGDPRQRARSGPPQPGTINLLVVLPVPLSPAALVNAVVTATEAKTQALVGSGIDGSGTSSDAICVACPASPRGQTGDPYAGPRSLWGARLARAVHGAVGSGTRQWLDRNRPAGG